MMNSKRNQTIAIARFLMYKHSLNQQLDGMTDEEYLADPIGLDVGSYVKDLMRYCPENVVDQVMEHQDALLRRLGTDYLSVIAFMPYEEDGGVRYKPIRSEAAEAVLEAAVQDLALELEAGEGLEL